MREFWVVTGLVVVGALCAGAYWLLFYSSPSPEPRYWYWDATVTFVWFNPDENSDRAALGKGRYKIRLPNGRHEEARYYGNATLEVYDCVLVKQYLSALTQPVRFEIVGPAASCWQPKQKQGRHI